MLQPDVTPRSRQRVAPPLPVLPFTIIGGDLSLTGTGVAIYKQGFITTKLLAPGLRGVERLQWLRKKWGELLDEHKPRVVAIEGYSFGSKGSRAHSIGEWGGTAKLAVMDRGIKGFITPPTTVKKFITANAHAKKNIIPLHLFKRYGIQIEQEDEADAACVSILIGAYLHGDPLTLPAFQQSCFKGIERMA